MMTTNPANTPSSSRWFNVRGLHTTENAGVFHRRQGIGSSDRNGRSKVALVLSGGGAKAAAHVGVLRVLHAAGIEPDMVVCSSAGALVGLFYCYGYNQLRMEDILHREIAPPKAWRWMPGSGVLWLYHLLRRGGLSRLLARYIRCKNLEELPRRMIAVASDVETAESVALDHGDITTALMASMSLPLLAAPVKIRGRTLADGSLLCDLPVEIARQQGADVVIAVDLSGANENHPTTSRSYKGFAGIARNLALPYLQLNRRQADLADVVIRPALIGQGLANFSQLAASVSAGAQAAQKSLPRILELVR